MLAKCDCPQVWDVFEVKEPQEGDVRFVLYTTVDIPLGKIPGSVHGVGPGESYYEGDKCPSCGFELETLLEIEGYELV